MQYLTLIHIDPVLLAELPQDEYDRLMRGCFAKADALRDAGCLHGSQQLLEPATARTLRTNNAHPKASSSARIRWLTAVALTDNDSAAALKLPVRAAASNT